jgi:hypothetical protein
LVRRFTTTIRGAGLLVFAGADEAMSTPPTTPGGTTWSASSVALTAIAGYSSMPG